MNLKEHVNKAVEDLNGLEAHARKLKNQNFADIIANARGRLAQLCDHPDAELVQRRIDGEDVTGGEPPKPEAKPTQLDQTAAVDGSGPRRQQPFPGTEIGGPDRGKEGVHVPGEPRFQNQNRDFSQPNAVDLNPDGTLRQAPNSKGAGVDDRSDMEPKVPPKTPEKPFSELPR